MESVLVEKSVNGGVLFRSFSSSFSLDNSFRPFITQTLPSAQPPLLPLPSVNPSWKERGMPIHRHHKTPRHASTSPSKREQRDRFLPVPVPVPVPVQRPIPMPVQSAVVQEKGPAILRDAMGPDEVVWTGTVYSVSPPPSSVPMPSFLMARGKGGNITKVTEKACGEGSGVEASATNELRKLLKL